MEEEFELSDADVDAMVAQITKESDKEPERVSDVLTLMGLVKESIESKSLAMDYPGLMEVCRQSGISSYTLNLLIDGAAKSVNGDKNLKKIGYASCFGWAKPPQPEPIVIKKKVKVVEIRYRWNWWTWAIVSVLSFGAFMSCYIIATNDIISHQLELIFR